MSALLPRIPIAARLRVALTICAFTLGGCYTYRPLLTPPPAGARVRVEYSDPRPAIAIATAKHGLVVAPDVRKVWGKVLEVRSDSIRISIIAAAPRATHLGTAILPNPADNKQNVKWSQQHFSAGRTLLLVPPLVLILAAICFDCGGMSF